MQTIHKTPVLGLIVNIHNLKRIYAKYCENPENDDQIDPSHSIPRINHLRTYAMSQDHLELFFGKIRSKNGHNNNPDVVQFKGAYRKLSANVSIKPPENANCMFLDDSNHSDQAEFDLLELPKSNIFSVSSRISQRQTNETMSDPTFQRNLEEFEEMIENNESEIISDLQAMDANEHIIDNFSNISIAYAASIIEERLESRTMYCECCFNIFKINEELSGCSVGFVSQKVPCASTYYLCKIADKYFKTIVPNEIQKIDYRVLYYKIFQEINYNNIYTNSDFKDHEEHRFHLVKYVVKSYLAMKTRQISKQITYEAYDKIIRSKLTKWIHFRGQ